MSCACCCHLIFFFFKQKTAYEMRISDWSSDVCSSDLRRARRVQRMDDLPRFPRRIEPVRVERDDAEAGLRALEGVRQQAAMLLGQIEIIHRPGAVEIGIGVEPLDKAQPLMAKIAFDLKIGVEAEDRKRTRMNSSHYCASRMPSSTCNKKNKTKTPCSDRNSTVIA